MNTTLLGALLVGSVPESIVAPVPYLPRSSGTYPTNIFDDATRYPRGELLDEIRMIGSEDSIRWMRDVFIPEATRTGYAVKVDYVSHYTSQADKAIIDERDITQHRITELLLKDYKGDLLMAWSTGGWSGNEDLIKAVLDNFWLSRFLETTTRGGHYTFVIPLRE